MRKKAIEKIPYLTGEKCNKKNVKYVVAVENKNVEQEKHLFLEIYENKVKSLKIPVYRFVYTKRDWGNYKPEDGKWSACSITDECNEQIWNTGMQRVDRVKGTYISQENIEKIKSFTRTEIFRGEGWWEFLKRLEDGIKEDRRKKRLQEREERLNERCEEIKELPEDFTDWYKNELFKNENYIYYKRKGRYATFWCSHCGESYTYATEQRDTYEGQFETIVRVPRNGNRAKCEKCNAQGFYKTAGTAAKTVYGLKKMCYVGQKYKENGMVMRYIQVEKFLSIGRPESYIVTEIARSFFEEGEKCITDYHLYNNYTGEEKWHDHNIGGMGPQIQEKAAAVYPGTYEELKETMFQYSGFKEYSQQYHEIRVADYLREYQRFPLMEMLVKMKLNDIVEKMVEYQMHESTYIRDSKASKPDKILGIYSERLKKLKESRGDTELLKILQMEKDFGKKWTEKQIESLEVLKMDETGLETVLRFMTLQKYLNRVEKYAGAEFGNVCGIATGRLREVSNTYLDYLMMRNARGYDMRNTVYLFPRDLEVAHQKMVEETNKQEADRRLREVAKRYPDIKKNYRKLRKYYYYEDENFIIRPAKSAEEIVMEGRILHHCVGGDGYLASHNKGKSIILMLRFKEKPQIPYITVEIESISIRQWYGKNDTKPDKGVIQKWLDSYVERLKGNMETEQVQVRIAG